MSETTEHLKEIFPARLMGGNRRIIQNVSIGTLYISCTMTSKCRAQCESIHSNGKFLVCRGCEYKNPLSTTPSVLTTMKGMHGGGKLGSYDLDAVKLWVSDWTSIPFSDLGVIQTMEEIF